jgi:hypothetical protein
MSSRAASAFLITALVTLAAVGARVVSSDARSAAVYAGRIVLTVESATAGRPIPAGFVGLSMEYPTIEAYAGQDPLAVNPVFEQLVRNLAPGQRPVLRIGGDTTDWTWLPVRGMRRPPWVKFDLTQNWLQVTRALARAVSAHLILSINLEANSQIVAGAEARALLGTIGRGSIEAFELGNEPELYPTGSWYRTPDGHHVTGRPRGYNFAALTRDYSHIARSLPRIPLAGPSTGGRPAWTRPLARFLKAEPRVGVVTMHRYGLDRCERSDPIPTIAGLMSVAAERGTASSVASSAKIAHRDGIPLRIEELNAVSCGGQRGVSDTFAAALWALDTLFEAARVGVDGVNIHTRPKGLNSLFSVQVRNGGWRASVRPEYYGLMMFAQAVPAGSRLLQISGASDAGRIHTWAILAPDGQVRVVFINQDPAHARVVSARIPAARGPGMLERLAARNIHATHGVMLGGQTFGSATATGRLPSPLHTSLVRGSGGQYVVNLPAASATMLTLAVR